MRVEDAVDAGRGKVLLEVREVGSNNVSVVIPKIYGDSVVEVSKTSIPWSYMRGMKPNDKFMVVCEDPNVPDKRYLRFSEIEKA